MHVSCCVEVGGEIVVRITPPACTIDEHFAATDRVSQSNEHAQLIRDSLDSATVLTSTFGAAPEAAVPSRDGWHHGCHASPPRNLCADASWLDLNGRVADAYKEGARSRC